MEHALRYKPPSKAKPIQIPYRIIGVLFILYFLLGFNPSFAAGNAFNDILSNGRFVGNISEIKWLVQIIDRFSVWLISIVGFYMITAAVLKECLTGAYLAYPRLFNKLAEIKYECGNMDASGRRGGPKPGGAGIFLYILSFIIPDIKPLTDFDDGVTSIRSHLTKGLIGAIVIVILGVAVYNGIYRDVLQKGAELGVHVVSNYLLKIDFVDEFDRLIEVGQMFEFKWANDNSKSGTFAQGTAKDIYLEILDKRDDIRSSETRSILGMGIETILATELEGDTEFFNKINSENYDATRTVRYVATNTKPTPRTVQEGSGLELKELAYTIGEWSNSSVSDSLSDTNGHYVVCSIIIKQKDANGIGTTGTTNTATISTSANGNINDVPIKNHGLYVKGDNYYFVEVRSGQVRAYKVGTKADSGTKVRQNIESRGDTVALSEVNGAEVTSLEGVTNAGTGLTYEGATLHVLNFTNGTPGVEVSGGQTTPTSSAASEQPKPEAPVG